MHSLTNTYLQPLRTSERQNGGVHLSQTNALPIQYALCNYISYIHNIKCSDAFRKHSAADCMFCSRNSRILQIVVTSKGRYTPYIVYRLWVYHLNAHYPLFCNRPIFTAIIIITIEWRRICDKTTYA